MGKWLVQHNYVKMSTEVAAEKVPLGKIYVFHVY